MSRRRRTTEEDDIEEIRKGFEMFDVNGTGIINPTEILEVMESMNIKEKNPFIYEIIESLSSEKEFRKKGGVSLEENTPAKILSSEEINEMIKNQIKYSKEQSNANGYKIIKQKNYDDTPKTGELLNLEQIKNEINQIEFEEEEQKKKNKQENNIDNGIKENYEEEKNNEENLDNYDEEEEDHINLNIEELKKDVLECED